MSKCKRVGPKLISGTISSVYESNSRLVLMFVLAEGLAGWTEMMRLCDTHRCVMLNGFSLLHTDSRFSLKTQFLWGRDDEAHIHTGMRDTRARILL